MLNLNSERHWGSQQKGARTLQKTNGLATLPGGPKFLKRTNAPSVNDEEAWLLELFDPNKWQGCLLEFSLQPCPRCKIEHPCISALES